MSDHATNRVHLFALVKRWMRTSGSSLPSEIPARDILVIFTYLGEALTSLLRCTTKGQYKRQQEAMLHVMKKDFMRMSRVFQVMGHQKNSLWAPWVELLHPILVSFPGLLRMNPLLLRDALAPFVDAFTHYNAPFERLHHHRTLKVKYRIDKDKTGHYLRSRGYLPSLPESTPSSSDKHFHLLPAELRIRIWKLVYRFPDSGIQFQRNEYGEPSRHMYTVSRKLKEQITIGRFLRNDQLNALTRFVGQACHPLHYARLIIDSEREIFAPMAINKRYYAEALDVFYAKNLFVLTTFSDAEYFLSHGHAARLTRLRKVALVYRGIHEGNHEEVYASLSRCPDLRQLHLYFCWGASRVCRPGAPQATEFVYKIMSSFCRTTKLNAIYCSGGEEAPATQRKAAECISQVLSELRSKCEVYCDGVLLKKGA